MIDDLIKTATISVVLTLVSWGIAVLFNVIKSYFWVKKGDKLKEIKESFMYSLYIIPGSWFLWFGILSPTFTIDKYGVLIGLAMIFCLVGLGMTINIFSLKFICNRFFKYVADSKNINEVEVQKPKETEGFIDNLHDSIKIVSDYGAILQIRAEGEFLYMAESRLPHSREKIVDAIEWIESFIDFALNDESVIELFIENHDYFRFDKAGVEYLFSKEYRESLKTGLAYLDGFVSDEKAELGKAIKKIVDFVKVEEITTNN